MALSIKCDFLALRTESREELIFFTSMALDSIVHVRLEHLARSLNYRTQTDLLILDFSKAFDRVAHKPWLAP